MTQTQSLNNPPKSLKPSIYLERKEENCKGLLLVQPENLKYLLLLLFLKDVSEPYFQGKKVIRK